VLTGERTLAVICGAADWSRLPQFRPAKAFLASATAIRDYLVSNDGLSLPEENLLWLFDQPGAVDQYDRIDVFMSARFAALSVEAGEGLTILFVYVGHAAFFGPTKDYCLLVRDTRGPIEVDTSLRVSTLARLLKTHAPLSSRVLVLDCCFAGYAAQAFQGAVAQAAAVKANEVVQEAGPDRGVALLCASSARNPAQLEHPSSFTLFGRELVKVLTTGDPDTKGPLSLRRVCDLIDAGLRQWSAGDAPHPEIHVPDQSGGDLAAVPLFPNPAVQIDGDLVFALVEAGRADQPWTRMGALYLAERLLGSVRSTTRQQAQEVLLGLVGDVDRQVAGKARELWHSRGLGEIPAMVTDHPLRQPTVAPVGRRPVGIDFGTTNSAVAVLVGGDVHMVPNSAGRTVTPSVVSILDDGEVLVGDAALRQGINNPDFTVRSVKLKLGSNWSITRGGVVYTAERLAGLILRQLVDDAEAFCGAPIPSVVITVPAYFDFLQHEALVSAAEQVGIVVDRLVSEPTAAAFTFGFGHDADVVVLVVDLGGGTLDVTLATIGDGVVEVNLTTGDNTLGGDCWDECLADYLATGLLAETGLDVSDDPIARFRLREAAEEAKIALSSAESTNIRVEFIAMRGDKPLHLDTDLTRREFERVTRDVLERMRGPIEQALDTIRKNVEINHRRLALGLGPFWGPTVIDQTLLVGGAARMPAVGRYLQELTGKRPYRGLIPEGVVNGASIQAGVLLGELRESLLLDVISRGIGIETAGGVFNQIVPPNTTIPTKLSEVFTTQMDDQEHIIVHVVEGAGERISDASSLAVIDMWDLPRMPKGVPRLEISFDLDANSLLFVEVHDLATGSKLGVAVRRANIEEARRFSWPPEPDRSLLTPIELPE
jgi:molecular chaperone DnaK